MFIEARVKKSINLTRFNSSKQIRSNELIGSSRETKRFPDKSPSEEKQSELYPTMTFVWLHWCANCCNSSQNQFERFSYIFF